jgi:hypothetical protein
MITIAVIVMGAAGIATWLLCAIAPLGWQDKSGFHYGKPTEGDKPNDTKRD